MTRDEVAALSTGIAARERLFDIPRANSRDQMAGCFVGRLRLQGELSQPQYEAAVMWQADCWNYSIAMRSPRPPGAVNLNATKGGSGDYENRVRSQASFERYELALKAVQEKQNEIRGQGALYAALNYCVTADLALTHMIGDLRTALNALAKHYGLNGLAGKRKAA